VAKLCIPVGSVGALGDAIGWSASATALVRPSLLRSNPQLLSGFVGAVSLYHMILGTITYFLNTP